MITMKNLFLFGYLSLIVSNMNILIRNHLDRVRLDYD